MAFASEASRYGTAGHVVRNPFGVMDVPDPNDAEVQAFAAAATLDARADDDNAGAWGTLGGSGQYDTIAGNWSSRWNGGADPTIPGDTAGAWKQGLAEARLSGTRVFLLFTWDHGARRGLIVSHQRIDGRWTGGRLDFRR